MRMQNFRPILLTLAASGMATLVAAQEEVSVQSTASPYDLTAVGPVYAAGTDEESAAFMAEQLPTLMDFINSNLSETQALSTMSGVSFDPTSIQLATDSSVRVYFLGEGAGYHNTLGYTTTDLDGDIDTALIFPDASSYVSSFDGVSGATADERYPLMPGDFVDLGTLDSGTILDLFLIANGANYPLNTFTADAAENPDGISHVVSFAIPDSPFIVLGFEDLYGGGDRDFNDLVIAIDIGAETVAKLANPEPATVAMALLIAGAVGWSYRRRNGVGAQAC